MRIAAVVAILSLVSSIGFSKTIHVPGDFNKIQDAIDSSVNGDTVLVQPGTYVENIYFLGKAITLKSLQGAAVTTIDGNQAGSTVTFKNGEGHGAVLQDFTVMNGFAPRNGGGILCRNASPTIANNIISRNSAHLEGGGIYCYSASPIITNNTISGNRAKEVDESGEVIEFMGIAHAVVETGEVIWLDSCGGGIYCFESSPTITYNTISGNASGRGGGGIYCHSLSPTIMHNTIFQNTSRSGGGINCGKSSPIIKHNDIFDNTARDSGGGIHCYKSSPAITHNKIFRNTSETEGGGIFCCGCYPTISSNTIFNNMANEGGGIGCNDSSPTITNNTIVTNSADKEGGGIWCSIHSAADVTNTILWNNVAPSGPEIWIGKKYYPSSLSISYSNVKGSMVSFCVVPHCMVFWGPGVINLDPLFVDPSNGDFHLSHLSPCRGSGDSTAAVEQFDFEGDPRIAHGTVDIGADEYYSPHCWTGDALLNNNLVSIPYPYGTYILPATLRPDIPRSYSIPMQAFIEDSLTNLSVMEVE